MSDYEFEQPGLGESTKKTSDPYQDDEKTVLEQLKERLTRKIERPEIEVEVPERKGVTVRFSPNITHHQMRAWRKKAGDSTKAGMDPLKFACEVIGQTCMAILVDGVPVTEDGNNVTFASDSILEWVGASRPIPDGIRSFYGVDPHIEAVAVTIMEKSGYGDDVEEVDPTTGS